MEWGAYSLLTSSLFLFYILLFSKGSGAFGQWLRGLLASSFGWGAWIIPLYLGHYGVGKLTGRKKIIFWKDSLLYFFGLLFLTCIFAYFPLQRAPTNLGGTLGHWVYRFFVQQFGAPVTFLISFFTVLISGLLLLRFSPVELLHSLKERILEDIEEWKEERSKLREKEKLKKKLDLKSPQELSDEKSGKIAFLGNGYQEEILPKISLPKIATPMPSKLKPDAVGGNGEGVSESPQNLYLNYRIPEPDLLEGTTSHFEINQEELMANGTLLEKTLEQFNVKAKVVDIHPGPVITRYDLTPAPGTRVQSIETLSNDVALAMKARSLRVLAPVPGKAAVGIEISNPKPAIVSFKEMVSSTHFNDSSCPIPFAMGKTTEGEVYSTDLCSTPHLLIAGATGSGKSVCIHALILSVLYRFKPDQIKIMMIDPKRLELSLYDGIPHLYDPSTDPSCVKVITTPKDAVLSLKKLVVVMEERYRQFAQLGVRNIDSFNEKAAKESISKVPYILVVIDELADLMVTVGKEIEDLIQRLAQMARAVGIHLVLATQRPSVDVITGVIKANLPSRIAFQVLSKMDSRVILDVQGAETLIGRGDMLYLAAGAPRPIRLQGAFVSEGDVNRVVEFIRAQNLPAFYEMPESESGDNSVLESEENKRLLVRAAKVVRDAEKVSGDLLRADKEIGSRYDWALTLLKKKGLIEKPQDTNRWKIYFDRLGEFLAEVESKEE